MDNLDDILKKVAPITIDDVKKYFEGEEEKEEKI